MKPLLLALLLVVLALAGHVWLSVALSGRQKRCVAWTASSRDDTPETVCECFIVDGGMR